MKNFFLIILSSILLASCFNNTSTSTKQMSQEETEVEQALEVIEYIIDESIKEAENTSSQK